MDKVKRLIAPAVAALFLCLLAAIVHPMERVDRVWSDVILTSKKVPVPDQYLIVEVTADDLRRYGGPFIQRDTLADLVGVLDEAGAERVLLDVILTGNLSTERDIPLVAAMEKIGPTRLAIARGSILPDPQFVAHSAVVDMRFSADQDGWTRNVGSIDARAGENPSVWLATGNKSRQRVPIDLRYDTETIERMSVTDVLTSSNLDLSGKRVVLAHASALAPSRTHLPLSPSSDRASATLLGSVSISDRFLNNSKIAKRAGFGLALLCLVIGFMVGTYTHAFRRIFLAGLAVGCIVIWINMAFMNLWGGQSYPTLQFLCYLIGVFTLLFHRLRLLKMMGGFLKGDLSPEEAWAWRSFEDSSHPVILLNGMGRVRRMNDSAKTIEPWLGYNFGQRCLREFGRKSGEITLSDQEGQTRTYALDWPNRAVPIIVLKDVSETAAQVRELQQKVVTDPVTGLLNRAGFDAELAQIGPHTDFTDYALFFLDMNGFKAVNDTYGHDAGDELLRIVGQRLSRVLRADDVLARLGGDEFAIIMKTAPETEDIPDKIAALEAIVANPIKLDDCTARVGIAVGYGLPNSTDDSVQAVLNRADQAMYRRKAQQKTIAA